MLSARTDASLRDVDTDEYLAYLDEEPCDVVEQLSEYRTARAIAQTHDETYYAD